MDIREITIGQTRAIASAFSGAQTLQAKRKSSMSEDHLDKEVNQALIRLNDALCSWERSTGRNSVLIIREEGGWQHRSMSGKPGVPDDVTDEQLWRTIR